MTRQRYGSATAQDLYEIFIGSGVLDQYPWWELVDDEDDPVGNEWYVVVNVGDDVVEFGRRLGVAQLWAAMLACGSKKIGSVPLIVAQKCEEIILGRKLADVRFNDTAAAAVVVQVALYGQVEWRVPHEE